VPVALLGASALLIICELVVIHRRFVSALRALPEREPEFTLAELDALAARAERLDALSQRVTRNIEAAAAVTAAITVLAIQLLHRGAPTATVVGFGFAAGSFVLSVFAAVLVLRTPIAIAERASIRASLRYEDGWGWVDPISAVRPVLRRGRDQAWRELIGRCYLLAVVTLFVLVALSFLANGQFSVSGR